MAKLVPFGDIGRAAKDLLSSNYPINTFKLEARTFAPNGVSFTATGAQDLAKGLISGEIRTKYVDKANGITFTEGWSSSNVISTQLEVTDQVAKGLRLDLNASFVPNVGQRNAEASIEYWHPFVISKIGVDLFKGPTFSGDISIGRDGFLIGGELGYDLITGRVNEYHLGFGYTATDYSLAFHAMDCFESYSASYFHSVNPSVEAGARATFDTKSTTNSVSVELGTRYFLDKTAFIKAKINNSGRLGIGYTQSLRPGVKLTLAGSLDTTRLDKADQKIGLALNFEG